MNHDDDDDSVVSGLRAVARNVDARRGTSARSPVCHDEGGPHQHAIRESVHMNDVGSSASEDR
jgi:hypothetical protein